MATKKMKKKTDRRGRPRSSLMGEVTADLQKAGIRDCKTKAGVRHILMRIRENLKE